MVSVGSGKDVVAAAEVVVVSVAVVVEAEAEHEYEVVVGHEYEVEVDVGSWRLKLQQLHRPCSWMGVDSGISAARINLD